MVWERKRIGIFEYDWSIYGFIKDLVIKFAEAGFDVDVFQKDPDISLDFTNVEQFDAYENIRYFNFCASNTLVRKIERKFQKLFGKINPSYIEHPKRIIDRDILQQSKKILGEHKYLCFIGIEKKGLIWAGLLSQIYQNPLIYYSLELYLEDHPGARGYSYLRRAEKHFHQLSGATIVQDKLRADALLKYNNVNRTNLLYFPISVKGSIVECKSQYIQQKFNLDGNRKILLCFGQIQDERFSGALVSIASRLRDDIFLVLHGFGDRTYIEYLKSIADPTRVVISFDFVKEEQLIDVISSAVIGLALYETTSSNDRLVAFSSVKVAYYLKCGVPIIAFKTESFCQLMSVYKCGELIQSIEEIPQKVEEILQDYDRYKEQALLAFKHLYDFDMNFEKFIHDFERFIHID